MLGFWRISSEVVCLLQLVILTPNMSLNDCIKLSCTSQNSPESTKQEAI